MTAHRTVRPRLSSVVPIALLVVLMLVVTTGVRAYAVEAFIVPSGSMVPTLQVGDRLVVDKLYSTVHRGDVVVFRRAPGDHDAQVPVLVKRVIGLPGETISQSGATIFIDGQPLAQPWLPAQAGDCAQRSRPVATTRIPAGQYFVMGDCRGDSWDSRFWGTVPAANIIGKVNAVVWRNNHPWLHWF